MKEKLYLASTGKEVKFGDQLKGTCNKKDLYTTAVITINESTLPLLKAAGVIVTEPPKENPASMVSTAIQRIANKTGMKPQKVESHINTISKMMPMAAFSIILREIAVMLDEKYPDHINDSDKLYCVSTFDGRIHEICKAHVKNYRNFAAFRTIEDAKLACKILREPLKEMFKSGK